jgi:hypothetical protein
MNSPVQVDEKAQQLVTTAQSFVEGLKTTLCRTPHEYQHVSGMLPTIKAKHKEIEGHRVFLKEPFLEGGRRIDAFFGPALKLLEQAERTLKKLQTDYEWEQERIAAAKQRELDEKARKEREALEAKARAAREKADREAAELRQQALKAQEEGNAKQASKLLVKAATTVQKSEEKAEASLVAAAQVVAPKVHVEIPIIQGQHTKTVWRARVVNAALVPAEYKVVDDALIQKYAKATEGKIPVPGLEFYPEKVKSAQARA